MRYLITILLLLCLKSITAQQILNGKITNTDQQPIAGVQVQLKGTKTGTVTDGSGVFHLTLTTTNSLIEITHIGYLPQTLHAKPEVFLAVVLQADIKQLEEVTVSTGYQKISKAQSAGAYEFIDKSKIENKVATDVISRLEGLGSISFDKNSSRNLLSIRGLSSILGPKAPLVVLDNFPYEGSLNNINPNDIESVTVLKDAAAASIWGTKAGNGVIVLTSKKAAYNQPIKVELNSNLTWGEKPRLWEQQTISNSDYIDVQQYLFTNGYYLSQEQDPSHPALPGVVEILIKQRDGKISAADATSQINALRKLDVRNDLLKYWYKPTLNEQVSMNLQGGSNKLAWFFSAAYDQNRNTNDDKYKRVVLRSDNSFTPVKNLDISLGVTYTQSNNQLAYPDYNLYNVSGQRLSPYTRLADDAGNPLAITHDYRDGFTDTVGGGKLLNWKYIPLQERNYSSNNTLINDINLNAAVKYTLLPGLSAEIRYLYETMQTNNNQLQSQNTYYTRDLINQYTQNPYVKLTRPIPLGAILDISNTAFTAYGWRNQLNYSHSIQKWNLLAFAGFEKRETHAGSSAFRTYGYNDNVLTSTKVDYTTQFYNLAWGYPLTIPYQNSFGDITNRYLSYYCNAALTYNNRYTFTVSARRDGSNLFGVKINQKFVPLWSTGFSWNIHNELFYKLKWLPYLKMRVSYGYSGNIDNSVSAFTTISFLGGSGLNNLIYANLRTPPNPNLRWEKTGILNTGFDFAFIKNRVSGSLDLYFKKGTDLLGQLPLNPTTGFDNPIVSSNTGSFQYKTNGASMKGSGIELTLHTQNIKGKFSWNTDWNLQYNTSAITYYPIQPTNSSSVVSYGTGVNPIVGKPVYSIFSYKWAGLDPTTGDPQGYLNITVSKSYTGIINNSAIKDLVYNGNALPPYFGSIINQFTWKNISLSATITWRLGHYFRRDVLSYDMLYNNYSAISAYSPDFSKRWQKPGDEKFTSVPSMVYPSDYYRDKFYQMAEVAVERADNIRLKDISLSYTLTKIRLSSLELKQLQFYVYANNIGILWKASKTPVDPDSMSDIPVSRTIAVGIRANF